MFCASSLFELLHQLIYGVLLPADLLRFFFLFAVCLIFVFGLSDGWIGSGAPIFPMKGRFDRVVQLLVHGYH